MKMGTSSVGAPHNCCFFCCTHTRSSFPLSLSLYLILSLTLLLVLSLKVTPTRFTPAPPPPSADSSAFLFCALGLAACCVLLCRMRDLCHTECKYMSKHAKHFTDYDMHTLICMRIRASVCMCGCVCGCVCANGKFGDCLQARYVRVSNAAAKAFTFLK